MTLSLRTSVVLTLIVCVGVFTGCGAANGSDPNKHIQEPVVRQFSPFMSPMDFNTLQQNPTFSDSKLQVSTDPRFLGKICIFFQTGTDLDPATVFLGGNPFLGPDPSSLAVQREVPGVGNVLIPVRVELVDATADGVSSLNAIICTPLPPFSTNLGDIDNDGQDDFDTNMPDGQYTIGLFKNLKNTQGVGLRDGPVFHTFTVGATDTIPPRVVTTDPVNGQQNVGAGVPPPAPPPGVSKENIASVTTSIFGDTSPDIVVRFTEGVTATSITGSNFAVVDAGAFVPGGGAPPPLAPAPTYPKLKSEQDSDTLPSNGHEAIWRVDPTTGGYPFGTQVQATVLGLWTNAASRAANPDTPDNPAPIQDLSGNYMELNFVFQFQTIAPPDLPQNPFPEFAIWWSNSDSVGAIDVVNQQGLADQFNGTNFPFGVPQNVVPQYTSTIANSQHIPNFDPFEINFDGRTNATTCHTWIYVQSANTGQVAILNSRDGVPVALIDSPTPGGIAVQVGAGSAQVLLVTNSGANTFTGFDIGGLTPGTQFLNGPLYIKKVQPTGNTPRAISISTWGGGISGFNRDGLNGGPTVPVIMYADFTDGTVNTITLSDEAPVRQFALGPSSAPNDIAFTPCFGNPAIMFAAISQGGSPGNGKVAYYVAGPGCLTGTQTNARPDAIVGDLSSFDGPDGLDDNFPTVSPVFFTVAESGSEANAVSTLGLETGAFNLPSIINRCSNVGANPTRVAHRASWPNPCIAPQGSNGCFHPTTPSCWYNGTEQDLLLTTPPDTSMIPTHQLYVCARGASQVTVIDINSGARNFYSPIQISGVRFVAGPSTQ